VKPLQLGRVILWMIGALLSFSIMAVSIRVLAGALSVFEILAVRSSLGLLILFALAAALPSLRDEMRPRRFGFNLVRSGVHFVAQYGWALGMTILPFATVFALEFTMPVWVTIFAVAFLGERVTASRAAVVVLGFVGALIILRPGLESFRPDSLIILGAAFGFAIFNTMTKKLTTTEGTFGIVFWMNAMQLPMAFLGSDPAFALKLGMAQVPAVLGIGIAGLSAHYCLAKAFHFGDAILVVPLDFLRLPLIALVGWWFFGEDPDLLVFVGAAIIVAGILRNLRAEARRA
jgi:drug/metabolite transporter (DMT)-like permease